MNDVLITSAFTLIRYGIGSGLFDRAAAMVRNLIFVQIPGEKKKERLVNFLKAEGLALSGIAVDLVIAIVRARYEKSVK
ncbi:MAG: hypothetical protein EOM21_18640 [Gammaproteobacteria bacterium]|nr:hypothetical protein [Gammaproteobacteria bacterium]